MPIYTYKCSNCDHQFEKRQRMTDAPLSECPVCDGNVRRVVNSVGIVFKGSGFYVTDNRNGSSKNGASAPAPSSTADNKETKKEKNTADGSDSSSAKAKKTAEAKVA